MLSGIIARIEQFGLGFGQVEISNDAMAKELIAGWISSELLQEILLPSAPISRPVHFWIVAQERPFIVPHFNFGPVPFRPKVEVV